MTERTRQIWLEAVEAGRVARGEMNRERQACLAKVASELPGKVEELAKQVAFAQADITRSIGHTGVKAFRAELAEAASQVAKGLIIAESDIDWPHSEEFFTVQPRKIGSALFTYLYGAPAQSIAAVFRKYGFETSVTPYALFDAEQFESLADAINSLGAAEQSAAKAKAEDDRAAVDELWH